MKEKNIIGVKPYRSLQKAWELKGWLRLFVDYVDCTDCREKMHLQKLHYLKITRDFKFFLTDNFKPVHMQLATSVNRSAKLAIFWMKPNFFLKKLENDPNSSQIMSTGSGRCKKSWPEICSAGPKGTSTTHNVQKYVLHVYLWKKTSLTNVFFKTNFKKF